MGLYDITTEWTKNVKKWVLNNKITVDKLHATTVGWPKIRYVRILNAATPPSTGLGILRLLLHQLARGSPNHQKGIEVSPVRLLWNGPL